jgi:hypothetical protein
LCQERYLAKKRAQASLKLVAQGQALPAAQVTQTPFIITTNDTSAYTITANTGCITVNGQTWQLPTAATPVNQLLTPTTNLWTNTGTLSSGSSITLNSAININGTGTSAGITITGNTSIYTDTVNWNVIQGIAGWGTPIEEVPKNHCGVGIRSYHRDRQFDNVTPAEMLALQLLRKMVGQDEFRRYLKHGFILARGASGLSYQIDRRARIVVWECGEKLASLCVHLKHDLKTPPTDEVVAKLLIVECDEADIWKRSNVSWFTEQRHEIAGDKALQGGGIYIGAAEGMMLNMMGVAA